MTDYTPRVLAKKPADQREDLSPINGSAVLAQTTAGGPGDSARTKRPSTGIKLVVRRMPPGLTEQEFTSVLGPDWELGRTRVDWLLYRPGKISNDIYFSFMSFFIAEKTWVINRNAGYDPERNSLYKISRPSRAYLHLVNADDAIALQSAVQKASWEDGHNSWHEVVHGGGPVVELAIFKKFSAAKRRHDPRQGTIDQDPEFMEFLSLLAHPTPAKTISQAEEKGLVEEETKAGAKVTTTPLIEYLREKKAGRSKDSSNSKGGRHDTGRLRATGHPGPDDSASTSASRRKLRGESGSGKGVADKPGERSSREPVKILIKKSSTDTTSVQITQALGGQVAATATSSTETPALKSRRAGIAAAARILQRDLNISPGSAHRRARLDAAKGAAEVIGEILKRDSSPPPQSVKSTEKMAVTPPHPAERSAVLSESSSVPQTASSPGATALKTVPLNSIAPATIASKRQPSARGRAGRGGKFPEDSRDKTSTQPRGSRVPPSQPVVLLKKPPSQTQTTSLALPAPPLPPSTGVPISRGGQLGFPGTETRNLPAPTVGVNARDLTRKNTVESKPPPGSSNNGIVPPSGGGRKIMASTKVQLTAGATRGFVKYANASQGVTESLLKEALQTFGDVLSVELDRRKGFAYVEFTHPNGLARAVLAESTVVARASVQVVERKDMKTISPAAPASTTTPTSSGGGGGGNSSGNASTVAYPGGSSVAAATASGRSRRGRRSGSRSSGRKGEYSLFVAPDDSLQHSEPGVLRPSMPNGERAEAGG